MLRRYKSFPPPDVDALLDMLGWMYFAGPTFKDPSFDELYPGREFDVVFFELTESLKILRSEIGESRYEQAAKFAARIRALCETTTEHGSPAALEARQLIREMEALLVQ